MGLIFNQVESEENISNITITPSVESCIKLKASSLCASKGKRIIIIDKEGGKKQSILQ